MNSGETENDHRLSDGERESDDACAQDSARVQTQSTHQLQLVRAGAFLLAIPKDQIAAIASWRAPAPLPHAPQTVLGVVAIQGRMLTVLALSTMLDAAEAELSPSHIIALVGDEQLAVAVDAVDKVIEIEKGQVGSHVIDAICLGALRYGDETVRVVDVKKLFFAAMQGRERRKRRV